MSHSTAQKYEKEYIVQSSDIDQLGHVNNVVYLQWVQDIATEAWNATATEEQKANLLWVVARHEIDYKRPAFEGEKVIIRTWVGKANDKWFERFTEVCRKRDDKVVIKALTFWAPIDAKTMRPTIPGDDVYKSFAVSKDGNSQKTS